MSKNESGEVEFLGFSIIFFLILLIEIKMLETENFQYMKVFLFISAAIFTVLFFIFLWMNIFEKDCNAKEVVLVSSMDLKCGKFADSQATKLVFDDDVEKPSSSGLPKYLKTIEFCSCNLDVTDFDFSKCKVLEEVIFHHFPRVINPNAFEKCMSLTTIVFLDKEGWEKHSSWIVPKSCTIKFDTTKEVILTDEGKISPVKVDVKVEKK